MTTMLAGRQWRRVSRRIGVAGVLLSAVALGGVSDAGDVPVQEQGPDRAKVLAFMRAKLDSSQSVLEGLVTDNFDKVRAGAEKMAVMSTAAEWHVVPGEDYRRRSEAFRDTARRLIQMADAKNSDGAALAYVQLTMSCIECHRAVRGPGVAAIPARKFPQRSALANRE